MHRTAFTALAAAAVATGALGVSAANAASLEQLINSNLQFRFEDDSVEDLGVDGRAPGVLDQGDTLRGVLSFPQFANVATGTVSQLNGTDNSAVHGLFEIQVAEKIPNPTGPGFLFTFEPYAPFAAELGNVPGAMVGVWESNTPLSPSSCNTQTACEGGATTGNLRLVLGFAEGKENIWAAVGDDNIAGLSNVAQGASAANFNVRINVLEDDLNTLPFLDITDPSVIAGETFDFGAQVVASGNINGTRGLTTEYAALNDADIQMAVVPVPAALPLFLAGLGALGMIGWRRNAV